MPRPKAPLLSTESIVEVEKAAPTCVDEEIAKRVELVEDARFSIVSEA